MAAPKFPLKMGDGSEVRTMEELREHADLYTLEQYYFDGTLLRWLQAWGHPWKTIIADIESYDGDRTLHETLCDAFQIPWSEDLEVEYQKRKVEEKPPQKERAEEALEVAESANISDEIADTIAISIVNDTRSFDNPYHKPRFIETKDYILRGRTWSDFDRIDKKSGVVKPLKTEQWLIHSSKCGNKLYSLDDHSLVSIDLETLKEETLLETACYKENSTQHFVLAPMATETIIAYRQSHSLSLFDISTREEIPIASDADLQVTCSNPVAPGLDCGSMFLTDDALYFLTETCKGTLDDSRSPLWGLCKYDIHLKKTSVLMSSEELKTAVGNCNQSTSILVNDQTVLLTNLNGFGSYSGSHYGGHYWATLRLTGDTTIEKLRQINSRLIGGIVYEDGILYVTCEDTKKYHLSFVDLNGGEQTYFLWEPDMPDKESSSSSEWDSIFSIFNPAGITIKDFENSLKSAFRLGGWFYYPIVDEHGKKQSIWKISLETGERVEITSE